jgi:hypothetical protein
VSRRDAWAVFALLAACRPHGTAPDAPDAAAATDALDTMDAGNGQVQGAADAAVAPIATGPLPRAETPDAHAREEVVLDLLSGGEPATRLPRDATDPDAAFDPGLRDKVAPNTPTRGLGDVASPAARGEVHLGSPTASVAVPAVDRVLAGLRPALRACYIQALQFDPALSGKATLVVKIVSSGEVASADVAQNSGLPTPMVQCLARKARNAQFDSPGPNGSTLQVPLTFVVSPNGG